VCVCVWVGAFYAIPHCPPQRFLSKAAVFALMLAGLCLQKKEEPKTKKDKKKERRKEQKKRKQDKSKKKKKDSKLTSESSAASSDAGDILASCGDPASKTPEAPQPSVVAPVPARTTAPVVQPRAEDDFFSLLGTDIGQNSKKLKPDPDKFILSEREYNPMLRGEATSQPVPESVDKIPKHLMVGDGGSSWRKRAQKRSTATTQSAPQDGDAVAGPGARRQSSRSRSRARRRSRSRSRSAQRHNRREGSGSRSRPRRRSRSRSHSPRRRSRQSRSRSHADHKDALRGRGAAARGDWRRNDAGSKEVKVSQVPTDVEQVVAAEQKGAAPDDVMRKMQAKYGLAEDAPAESQARTNISAVQEEEPEDANALGAMAMEAMLSGDMARYEELNRRLERKQAALAAAVGGDGVGASSSSTAKPREDFSRRGPNGQRVEVLEEVDAAGRSVALLQSVQSTSLRTKKGKMKGVANVVQGKSEDGKKVEGYFQDDEVSLEDLVRRERIEGVQDYETNVVNHILKKGNKFRVLHEEDDEAYALGWYENSSKQTDAKRLAEKQPQQEARDKQRIQKNLEYCTRCMESKRFGRKDALISVSPHAYLCFAGFKEGVLPDQVFIAPLEHVPAGTELDDAVWTDIRNYQKCLVRYFEAQEPARAVLFTETAIHSLSRDKLLLGSGPHTVITAYPIELELLVEARSFWKKAFDEAENEFITQHKKVIETSAKTGVRGAVPRGFPYVHVDFSLGGGYAHVVEDIAEFPKDFMQHTVAGMCELTILDRAYTEKEQHRAAMEGMKQRFAKGFDWVRALQS